MRLITLPAGSIVEIDGQRLRTTREGVWPEVNIPAQPASEPEPLRDATPLDALRAIAEAAGNLVDTLADDPDGFWWEPEFRVLSDKLAALSGVTDK